MKLDPAHLAAALRSGVARFDARSRRERLLMIAAVAALAFLLVDALWLTPAGRAYKAAQLRERQAQTTLDTLRVDAERLRTMNQVQNRQLLADLATWRQRVREGDAELRSQEATLVGPERMVALLEQLLARHGQLRVRAMQSLPRSELLAAAATTEAAASAPAPAPAPAAAASAPGTAAPLPTLYRHGVELTIEGSFADLLSYLHALEALPQRLSWGGLQFKVGQYPTAQLTLRLYTLSLDRHWLEI